ALGAELQRLTLADGRELLWNGDPAWWRGRAPILFPIVGKAPGGKVAVRGQEAEMGQHGFARRSLFDLEGVEDSACRFVLRDSAATRASYPCAFRLAVSYQLAGARLSVSAEVENAGEAEMPFSLGFHPAFRWPLPGAEGKAHVLQLANRAEPQLARLSDGLMTAARLPSPFTAGRLRVEPEMFEADAMIFPEGAGDRLSFGPESGGPVLDFSFENTPNLGIWTKPGAPYLCIEPWHGMAAMAGVGPAIAARPYAMVLRPGGAARFGWSVALR
ncbi:aldose 1-epimerase family protein, partial [Thioclava sp. BHET1]